MAIYPYHYMRKIFDIAGRFNRKISVDVLTEEPSNKPSKIQQIAYKFANKNLILPPPMEGEDTDTIPAPPGIDTEPAPPMDTEPAPAPVLPTMPSPATPAFMGEVDRSEQIGDYTLISEVNRDRKKQAISVYIKDADGEVIADWIGLGKSESDFVWRVANDILKALI